jgi:S-methylmethionine-dependent homocysteine/selenocysteine methylase
LLGKAIGVTDVIAPADFAARVVPWRERGARLLGGCCGKSPARIAPLAAALR